jgi:FkbM family methyltransferase
MSFLATISNRISHRTVAGRLLRLPLHLVPDDLVVPVLGGINRGMRWSAGAGPNSKCWLGTFEEDHAPALQQLVRKGMVAYDIGANSGFYTLALSRLVGSSGKVFSFEPDARSTYYLRRHLRLNKIENVTVVQIAISNSTGLVAFDGWKVIQSGAYVVPTISLDEFIAAGHPEPGFIKMDIEGAEAAALQGAQQLLDSAHPNWLMATHSAELTVSCKATLASYGYRFTGFDCVSDPGDAGDFMALCSA